MGDIHSYKTYRHESNPQEKIFHDKFKEVLEDYADLLVFPPANNAQTYAEDTLTEREKRIMLGTIQWLGSPLGRTFLENCGYVKEKDTDRT